MPQIFKLLQAHESTLAKYANKQIMITDLKTLIRGAATESELQSIADYLKAQQDVEDFDSSNYIDVNDLLDHLSNSQSPGSCSPS